MNHRIPFNLLSDRHLLVFALVVSVGAFLVNQIYDLDVWWQVAIGRDILSLGAVPQVDAFTAAAMGRAYHDSHWAFQLFLAIADRAIGMVGVQLVMIVFWGATIWCVERAVSRWVGPEYAIPLVFLVAMASMERFLPRPELVTFLGVALFYWRLQAGRYRSVRELAVLLVAQLIWVNGHGLFVLGPYLVGCYWLAAAVGDSESRRRELPALTRALILIMVATLLTPYGIGNWRYALLLFQEAGAAAPELLKSLGELSPTFGAANRAGVAFWFFLVLLILTGVLTCRGLIVKRRLPLARFLVVAGMLAAALTGRRNMVLFALVAAPFAAELLSSCQWLPRTQRWARALSVCAVGLMLVWSWYPLSGRYYLRMEIPSRFGLGATPSFFPHGLPAFLERIGYRGQVFNSNTLGGFYLYHSHPGKVPFTDGRWEIYDLSIFDEIRQMGRSSTAWRQFSERHSFAGVLLQHASAEARALLPLLRQEADWRLVYLDRAASFWLKGSSGIQAPSIVLGAANEIPPVERVDDCMILDMFYQHMAADTLRIHNLQRALAYGQRTEWLLTALGSTQVKLARYDDARQTFETLRREFPRNITALNELAFLAWQRGDMPTAEQLLRQVLEIDAQNTDAQANIQRLRDERVISPERNRQ